MSNGTKVVKRNGNTEPLDLNKLHVMVEEACKDLAGVSACLLYTSDAADE